MSGDVDDDIVARLRFHGRYGGESERQADERRYRDRVTAAVCITDLRDRLATAEARVGALDIYLRHGGLCGIVGGYGYCTCGLDAARSLKGEAG